LKQNTKYKIQNTNSGLTLIELLVAMFILMMVMGGMTAVSVAAFRSYQKSKAIKVVLEDIGFALNSIAKDVRMGKVESNDNIGSTPRSSLVITRNQNVETVCYSLSSTLLNLCNSDCSSNCRSIVDLSGTGMSFNTDTSGFYSQRTNLSSTPPLRGWVEINLNIENSTMETDSIHVQTIVSSRDYGWEGIP
jgi:type II secretory pathway pseudopilin PulG